MSEEAGIPEWPNKPVPPEAKRLLPEWAMLWRGLALAGLAIAFLWGAVQGLRSSALLAPVALLFTVSAALAGWASAIHLTGGERFDDHPWV